MPDAQAIVVRAPTPTDLAAVVELINACSLAVGGVPDMTPAMLRADWTDPNFAPETDAWLALTADGRVVGYETVYLEGAEGPVEVDGYVLPEQQGRGIGTRLLRLAEARARSLRAQGLVLRGTIEAASGGAQQLFAAEGYRCVRHFARMEIELATAPLAPEWPAGISVRPFVLAHDARATHAVVEQAFQDHWGHTPVAFDAWRQSLIEQSKLPERALTLLSLFDAFEHDAEPYSFRDLILARKYAGLLAGGASWSAIARSVHRSGPVTSLTALSL